MPSPFLGDSESWDIPPTSTARIQLQNATMSVRKAIEDRDLALTNLAVETWRDDIMRSMVVELIATVTAAKVVGDPYVVSEKVVETVVVPRRAVRDGILLWIGGLQWLPNRIGWWVLTHARQRTIDQRVVVTKQQIDYYACPHVGIKSDRVHLSWIAEKSGQLDPKREGSA